ncbi:MAG: nucleoside diphosphate kinase regulator [Hyphomicrobiaceae bacterium]
MTQFQHDTDPLPSIIVSDIDHRRLIGLAAAAEERAPDVAGVLQSEMERAQVMADDAMPGNTVRMGSSVEYSSDTGDRRRVTLVYPGDADIAEGRISILTPIGAALIGLSSGQSIAWTARDGRRHRLTVLDVTPPSSGVSPSPERRSSVVDFRPRENKATETPPLTDGDDPGPQAA